MILVIVGNTEIGLKFENTFVGPDLWSALTAPIFQICGTFRSLNDFEIKSIDMIGYPDYLEYEMGEGREVLSWWKYNLVRKKDKKKIILPIHLSDSFDDKGKIVAEFAYYSEALLAK